MRNSFPGGVYDDLRSTAFVAVPGGDLVAVDLRDGAVLWRKRAGGKPIVATGEHVLAQSREAPGRLRLFDSGSGMPVAEIDLTEGDAGLRGTSFEVLDAHFAQEPGRARISLLGEPRYTGGAAPPKWLTRRGPMLFDLSVDRQSGRVELEASPIDRGGTDTALESVEKDLAASPVELTQESGPDGAELVLQGRDPDGRVTWTTALGKMSGKGPRPPRP